MKKLIAAAVAAAVIAPATTMAAGPTLYGKLHTSITYKDNNSSGDAAYDEWSLQSHDSRIGVKGSEDLGNGMKVGYLIEWEVDMDGNNNDLGTRNRAVTLSGDWGTALAGKWDTPFKTVGRKVDLFGDRIGDLRSLNAGAMDARANNVVAYVTPNMAGFSATVAYVFDVAGGPDDTDRDAWSFNAIYNNGPLFVGLGYSDYSDAVFDTPATSTGATVGFSGVPNPVTGNAFADYIPASTTAGVSSDEGQTNWRLAGSYAIGDFKILGSYTDMSDIGGSDADSEIWTVGASFKMGNTTLKGQYADRDESDSDDNGADMWVVGLDHAMSKRTTVYAAYATVSNDDNSGSQPWWKHDGKVAQEGGEDADSFSVGIIHKF